MSLRFQYCRIIACAVVAAAAASALAGSAESGFDVGYAPEPELEKAIQQARSRDADEAKAALARLAGLGADAERALRWHLLKEIEKPLKPRWAELLARAGRGRVGYRITVELQPDGSGTLTLWSDRTVLAECGKRYDRLLGQRERMISEEDLKRNVYSKGELFECLNEGMKAVVSHVEMQGDAVEATGVYTFRSFEALASFAAKFDSAGYYLLSGATLSDSPGAVRTYRFKKGRDGREQADKNLLVFHDVLWEFVLDVKSPISESNTTHTVGSKLFWTFNCYEMVSGQAEVKASYDAKGLSLRPAPKEDTAVNIPPVVQANQPLAVVRHTLIKAKIYRQAEGPRPPISVLRERGQLVELDGRDSTPAGAALQYCWTQTFGANLNVSTADLAQPRVCLLIKEAGEYRFELAVTANSVASPPVEVKVIVEDDAVQPPPAITEAQVKPPEPPPAEEKKKDTASATKPPVPADPAKAGELHAQGTALLKSYQFTAARDVLKQAAALDPQNAVIAFDCAAALMEAGNITAAGLKFQELAATTNNPRAYMNAGHCCSRAGNLVEARRWYVKGTALAGKAVSWEPLWQLGHSALESKDFKTALDRLTSAEKSAPAAQAKDPRLLYDLARALHASQKDDEALVKIDALRELGCAPDEKLVADIKQGAEAARKVAVAPPGKKDAPPPPENTGNQFVEPKTAEPPKVAMTKPVEPPPPPEVKKAETKAVEPPKVVAAKPVEPPPPPEAKKADIKPTEPPKVVAARPVEPPPPPEVKKADTKPTEPPKTVATRPAEPAPPPEIKKAESTPVEPPKVAIKNGPPVLPAETKVAVTPPVEPPKTSLRKPEPPPPPKKPLPPVPEDFDQALAAGKKACAEGARLAEQNKPETKADMQRCFDEAEAMFQGAWRKKPGDEMVMAAFKELSNYVNVIAIPRNPVIKTKVKGLVALDAELSIFPQGKPKYYVWEQVGGETLGLRPEDLSQKTVGLRIVKPGLYQFELAVSDGSMGGNPVTVTVEVVE